MAKKRKRTKSSNQHVPPNTLSTGPTDRDYEAEDAHRTIVRAHKYMGDKTMMGRVRQHARKEREANDRILRLDGKKL